MIKSRITRKELENGYDKVIRAGYCELQNLLRVSPARYYNCGVYGWNWDVYEIETSNGEIVAVCTGYRGLVGKRITGLEQFEKQAEAIWNSSENYGSKLEEAKKLLKAFADYIVNNYKK